MNLHALIFVRGDLLSRPLCRDLYEVIFNLIFMS